MPNFEPSAETLAEYGPRPCPWTWPETVGVHVGSCVVDGRRFRHQAHAHNTEGSAHFGWVCVLSHRRLFAQSRDLAGNWHPTNGPSQLMLHERAHLLTPGHGHDHVWMAAAYSLGYRFRQHEKDRSPASWRRFQAFLAADRRAASS